MGVIRHDATRGHCILLHYVEPMNISGTISYTPGAGLHAGLLILQRNTFWLDVLTRDTMLAQYAVMCPSVRLSVISRYCTKTVERRIMQTTPYDRPWTLIFWYRSSRRNYDGVTPKGGAK